MNSIIKTFADDSFLEYGRGKFDDWCVFYNDNMVRRPPLDKDYFADLVMYSEKHSVQKVYFDYVQIYDMTGKEIDQKVFDKIDEIAMTYFDDALEIGKIFSILYMAMIAEERKAYTKLGKRIKRLGIHKLLIEHYSVHDAANFMKGMGWREIDVICKECGF